jgi:UPF0716 protein FxsA
MNVAKWVLCVLMTLPFLELAAFIAVAAVIGFGWALGLLLAGSLAGLLVLRRAGSNHVARMRTAIAHGDLAAIHAASSGGVVLFAGILLLVPGFITDLMALALLIPPVRRAASTAFNTRMASRRDDGVVDLAREQWHQVPDPSLPDRRQKNAGRDRDQ